MRNKHGNYERRIVVAANGNREFLIVNAGVVNGKTALIYEHFDFVCLNLVPGSVSRQRLVRGKSLVEV